MMSGPRLTAPASRLVRSISTTAAAAVPKSSTLLTGSKAAAPLSRKYADLLRERNIDPDHPRHLTTRTSNRPHPPPRKLRLMQTFSSTAPVAARADSSTIDFMVFPGSAALEGVANDPFSMLRVPLMPDNFASHHAPETIDEPVAVPEISIVAAKPELVTPAALTEVEGMDMDGVELKFVHEDEAASEGQGMLTDLWKGLVDDVFSSRNSKPNLAM
ncbi:hypothetical protein F4809DRAFT_594914 [Biscogniauxia mediterranea]|nr:hypothetical protein F4809DRAFT_594914 [Biscogniauxia mediterranea]